MTRPCPTHPDIRDANHLHCWRCDAETADVDHAAGAAKVRAALASAPRPAIARQPQPEPADLAATRERADRDQEQP